MTNTFYFRKTHIYADAKHKDCQQDAVGSVYGTCKSRFEGVGHTAGFQVVNGLATFYGEKIDNDTQTGKTIKKVGKVFAYAGEIGYQ